MNKRDIKKELESLGYSVFEKENYIWGGVKGDEGPIPETNIINSGFNIFVYNEKVTVVMLNSTVGEKIEFNEIKELINFITKNAPVKEK